MFIHVHYENGRARRARYAEDQQTYPVVIFNI